MATLIGGRKSWKRRSFFPRALHDGILMKNFKVFQLMSTPRIGNQRAQYKSQTESLHESVTEFRSGVLYRTAHVRDIEFTQQSARGVKSSRDRSVQETLSAMALRDHGPRNRLFPHRATSTHLPSRQRDGETANRLSLSFLGRGKYISVIPAGYPTQIMYRCSTIGCFPISH